MSATNYGAMSDEELNATLAKSLQAERDAIGDAVAVANLARRELENELAGVREQNREMAKTIALLREKNRVMAEAAGNTSIAEIARLYEEVETLRRNLDSVTNDRREMQLANIELRRHLANTRSSSDQSVAKIAAALLAPRWGCASGPSARDAVEDAISLINEANRLTEPAEAEPAK